MNTEALKISIAKRILNIDNSEVLDKISKFLDKENIIGYDSNGNIISEKSYVSDIHESLKLIAEDKLETYSSDEVKKKILG